MYSVAHYIFTSESFISLVKICLKPSCKLCWTDSVQLVHVSAETSTVLKVLRSGKNFRNGFGDFLFYFFLSFCTSGAGDG